MMLKEARRLHALGFAIHWLKPRSKAPVESGWTTGPRKTWEQLKKAYRPGYNVGVRLGEPSKINGAYLACIDVDIKKPEGLKPAVKELALLTKGFEFPEVRSGSGGGSRHLYCITKKPFKMITVAKHPTWEICIYSTGRQMVLPPSIHPSGKPYVWKHEDDLPLFKPPAPKADSVDDVLKARNDFEAVEVDLVGSTLSSNTVDLILRGEGCDDRSAGLMSAAMAMCGSGFSDNEVLSVLTDKETFLGRAAYKHVQSGSRKRAAAWIEKYTLRKARRETDGAKDFDEQVFVEPVKLSAVATKEQEEKLFGRASGLNWRHKLERNEHGKLKTTLQNLCMVLENAVGSPLLKRDEFAGRDRYVIEVPWGRKPGQEPTDEDLVNCKMWFAQHFSIEPNTNSLTEAFVHLSTKNTFHPVRDYINGIKWDGVERINTWLKDYLHAKGPKEYLEAVSSKFLCAMVARVFEPGIKFDQILILEGAEDMGKSSAAEILASPKWFCDALPDLKDKDARLNLVGAWVIEMAELASFRRADTESTKAFLSARVDRVQAPYGRRWEDIPRQSVFIGTTNHHEYAHGSTGHRRLWPVTVEGRCDFAGLRAVRDQLFAEAYVRWNAFEETLYLDGKAKEQAKIQQGLRVTESIEDTIEEKLRDALMIDRSKELNDRLFSERFKLSDLTENSGPLESLQLTDWDKQKAGSVLRKLGFEKYHTHGRKLWRKIPEKGG